MPKLLTADSNISKTTPKDRMKRVLMGLVMIASFTDNLMSNDSRDRYYDNSESDVSSYSDFEFPEISTKKRKRGAHDSAAQATGKIKLSDQDPRGGLIQWYKCGRCPHEGHFDTSAKHMHRLNECSFEGAVPCLNCKKSNKNPRPRFTALQDVLDHNKIYHSGTNSLLCWACGTKISTKGVNKKDLERKYIQHVAFYTNPQNAPQVFKGFSDQDIRIGKPKIPLKQLLNNKHSEKIVPIRARRKKTISTPEPIQWNWQVPLRDSHGKIRLYNADEIEAIESMAGKNFEIASLALVNLLRQKNN